MDIIHAESAMKNKENKAWFKTLWEYNADEYQFFELARYINPDLTFFEFDYGWQYRTILDINIGHAIQEFTQILFNAI